MKDTAMRMNHQTTAFHKHLFLHDSSVAIAPSSLSGAHNRTYLASAYAFAQIHPWGTSDMPETLYEIVALKTMKLKESNHGNEIK
jgi:hypothetical protein